MNLLLEYLADGPKLVFMPQFLPDVHDEGGNRKPAEVDDHHLSKENPEQEGPVGESYDEDVLIIQPFWRLENEGKRTNYVTEDQKTALSSIFLVNSCAVNV
ncbi:hypothetical protein SDC9_53059 [bioreactor metagenome]|uniref:Uncharacterized protein n=1 Tax=bioreactor metagenome TaxID=1076179 RepID=A0A644WS81_9ZZZZ|nr:hypothetical protein [Sphaerochaeta sp.]